MARRMPDPALPDAVSTVALTRFLVIRPHLEDGVTLRNAAKAAEVPLRTAQRWLHAYRADGFAGLNKQPRTPSGRSRLPAELVEAVEGMALRKPPPSVAHIHREVTKIAAAQGWTPPSYTTVRSIVVGLDPGLRTLAHGGPTAYRDMYELVYRRESEKPNDLWQADHTQLDIMVLGRGGQPARPWLSAILDDHSRALTGYTVYLEAPSALQTALALRQAIWRKTDPAWKTCGLPAVLYSDHGADFTSEHLAHVCADTSIQLIHSTAGVPQGRGKIERFFGTITSELLPTLPGYIPHGTHGKPVSAPRLTLAELDAAIERFVVHDYNARVHSETGQPPTQRWLASGWLPRMPESVEQLDLLLLTVAKPRVVHRDGVHVHGVRYLDLTLAAYVGEAVVVRFDPRDLAEIRVFHHGKFLCRALAPELASKTITLKDLQAARTRRRRELRVDINKRRATADSLTSDTGPIPASTPTRPRKRPTTESATIPQPRTRLRLYRED